MGARKNWTIIGVLAVFVMAVVFCLTCCAHSKHGFKSEQYHGGLWKFCDTEDDFCEDVDGKKVFNFV